MKKLLDVVNNKEILRKIFDSNEKLKQQCLEESLEACVDFLVEDIEKLEGVNYSIDVCGEVEINIYNKNNINDYEKFINKLYDKAIVKDGVYGIIESSYDEQDRKLMKRIIQGCENLRGIEYCSKNYDQLEDWIKEKTEMLKGKLIQKIKEWIDEVWNDESVFNWFVNGIEEEKDLFYNEQDYTLYENVIKSYK